MQANQTRARAALLGAALVIVGSVVGIQARETYRVTVTRVGDNLYRDDLSRVIIETQLCLELALSDRAILRWDGPGARNWIVFERGNRCDVVGVR